MENSEVYYATGRRKTSIAKTWIKPGSGNITINKRPIDEYFLVPQHVAAVKNPLLLANKEKFFDIDISVRGGGISGQAGAISHGITRALIEYESELRGVLKKAGLVKRDSRIKERKKYGQKAARARFQFSKR